MLTEFFHTYSHWTEGMEMTLPSIIRYFSLPILNTDSPAAATYIFWGMALLYPLGFALSLWRTKDEHKLLAKWLYGATCYWIVFIPILVIAGFGLWIPFSLLGKLRV